MPLFQIQNSQTVTITVTSGTGSLNWASAYYTYTASDETSGGSEGTVSISGSVTVVPAPGTGNRCVVKDIVVFNPNATALVFTLTEGSTTLPSIRLQSNEHYSLNVGAVVTQDGEIKGRGTAGSNAFLYVGYADASDGTGYSTSPTNKSFIAFFQSSTAITPSQSTFTGLWTRFRGVDGTNGSNGASYSEDIRSSVTMTSNGTSTINCTANGAFKTIIQPFNQLAGTAIENNLIDITNASAERFIVIDITRDNAASGTKTINFAGSGRTFLKSWGSGSQAILANERWCFTVRALSSTLFIVNGAKYT